MVKKVLLALILLLCIISCYRVDKNNINYQNKSFYSEVNIGDSIYYYMNASIDKYVKLQFVKKEICKSKQIIPVNDQNYIQKDTLICLIESFSYTTYNFKELLESKNQQDRDTTIMKFTPNMYIQWSTFDEMFYFLNNQ